MSDAFFAPHSKFSLPGMLLACGLGLGVWWGLGMTAMPAPATQTAGVLACLAVLWALEAVPLAVSSLVPVVWLPLLGIVSFEQAASGYVAKPIFLFLGGFLLALGLEETGLHRRFALGLLRLSGTRASAQLAGLIAASGMLSMWISNTSAALLLLPVAVGLGHSLKDADLPDGQAKQLRLAWILAVAWGASIGGVATPVGSPPNALLLAILARENLAVPSFFQWMLFGVPLAAIMCLVVWQVLLRGGLRRAHAQLTLEAAGPWSRPQRLAAAVFALAGLGWLVLGLWPACPGLADLGDSGVALAAGGLMLLCPARGFTPLLPWRKAVVGVPWSILLLVGAGLAMAQAMGTSGLSQTLGRMLPTWDVTSFPMLVVAAMLCIFASEVGSNTASAAVLLPVLLGVAQAGGNAPWPLLLAGTLGCSFGFMLPVSSPPNTLAYATGRISAGQMVRLGLVVNLIAGVVVAGLVWLVVRLWGAGPT